MQSAGEILAPVDHVPPSRCLNLKSVQSINGDVERQPTDEPMVRPSQLHRRDADAKDLLTFAAGQLLSETDKYAVSPCPGGRRTAAACER